MKYIILFEDNPSVSPDIRQKHMPEHLAFLEKNANTIDAAGPLHTLSGKGAGGIWIVDTDTEEKVEHLIHDDPFWSTGLRKSYKILKWTRVFADGLRRI